VAKTHVDLVSAAPDPVKMAMTLRALTSGRRRAKASVVPLWGEMEGYFKVDSEFGPMFVKRKMTSTIRSPEVKDRNKIMRECAGIIEALFEDREDENGRPYTVITGTDIRANRDMVRKAFQICLRNNANVSVAQLKNELMSMVRGGAGE